MDELQMFRYNSDPKRRELRTAVMLRLLCTLVILLFPFPAWCQTWACGRAPVVQDETLKSAVQTKAEQIAGSIKKDEELNREIETVRSDIFSDYPQASRDRTDAYLLYVICQIIMSDDQMTAPEKTSELLRVREKFNLPGRDDAVTVAGQDTAVVVAEWVNSPPIGPFQPPPPWMCPCLIEIERPLPPKPFRQGSRAIIKNECDHDIVIIAIRDQVSPPPGILPAPPFIFVPGRAFSLTTIQPRGFAAFDYSGAFTGGVVPVNC